MRDDLKQTFIAFVGGKRRKGKLVSCQSDISRIDVLLGDKHVLTLALSDPEASKLSSNSDLSLFELDDRRWSEPKKDEASGVIYRSISDSDDAFDSALARAALPTEHFVYGAEVILNITHCSPEKGGGAEICIYSPAKEDYISIGKLPYTETFTETGLRVPPSVIADIFTAQKLTSEDEE